MQIIKINKNYFFPEKKLNNCFFKEKKYKFILFFYYK